MHSMYDRASCTAGSWTQNLTVRIDMRCLKKPRKTKDRVSVTHTWLHTHSIFIYVKLTIQSQSNTLLESETSPLKKNHRKGMIKAQVHDQSGCTRKAYVTLCFTTEDGHLWVVEGSRLMDKWIGVFGHHGHDIIYESSRLSVAIWTRGQVIVQCWWQLLWHSPSDLDVISHGSAVIKGNKQGLGQKEFSQLLQFNIYFQLSSSPITGSAPPC